MKKFLKKFVALILATGLLFSVGCGEEPQPEKIESVPDNVYNYNVGIEMDAKPFYLTKDGVSSYDVLLCPDASQQTISVAHEIKDYIYKVSGVNINVVFTEEEGHKYISLGQTELEKTTDIKVDDLKNDGYILKTIDENIFITSNTDDGIRFGAYNFLERFLGIRWLSEVYTHIPKVNDIEIHPSFIKEEPEFAMRHWLNTSCYPDGNRQAQAFFYHQKFDVNHWYNPGQAYHNSTDYEDPSRGVGTGWVNKSDKCEDYYPDGMECPEEFKGKTLKETHPQFFTDFTRPSKHYDLCFTNGIDDNGQLEEGYSAASHTIKKIKGILEKDTEHKITHFHIGHMDVRGIVCKCERCKERIAKYKYSGVEVMFVNCVARHVNEWLKETQDRTVDFSLFAYHDSEFPPVKENEDGTMELLSPLVKADEHVHARIALIDMDPGYGILDKNQDFEYYSKIFKGWEIAADKHLIWDYVVDFVEPLYYFPNLCFLKENYQYYKDHHVDYIMGEASSAGYWHTYMRMYVASKLFWNLNWDVNYLINEFIDLYFGPASQEVKDFVTMMDDFYEGMKKTGSLKMGVTDSHSVFVNPETYSVELVKKMYEISENAIAKVEMAENLSDVERYNYKVHTQGVKLQPMRLMMQNFNAYYTPDKYTQFLIEFLDICDACGITKYASMRDSIGK